MAASVTDMNRKQRKYENRPKKRVCRNDNGRHQKRHPVRGDEGWKKKVKKIREEDRTPQRSRATLPILSPLLPFVFMLNNISSSPPPMSRMRWKQKHARTHRVPPDCLRQFLYVYTEFDVTQTNCSRNTISALYTPHAFTYIFACVGASDTRMNCSDTAEKKIKYTTSITCKCELGARTRGKKR